MIVGNFGIRGIPFLWLIPYITNCDSNTSARRRGTYRYGSSVIWVKWNVGDRKADQNQDQTERGPLTRRPWGSGACVGGGGPCWASPSSRSRPSPLLRSARRWRSPERPAWSFLPVGEDTTGGGEILSLRTRVFAKSREVTRSVEAGRTISEQSGK